MTISKITYAALLTGIFSIGQAQQGKLGINTTNPQATIDMKVADVNLSTNSKEGLLIPRLGRQRADNMGPSVEQGTMIYVNNLDGPASGRVANVNKVGFYHFNGTEWISLNNEKTPYDVVITPSDTTLNMGESISFNVKSNIPAQFFYNSSSKGIIKRNITLTGEIIPEFTLVGTEGNNINSSGTDFLYTPSVPGSQTVILYFFDSDKNLITKTINLNVMGNPGDGLIATVVQTVNQPNNIADSYTFTLNSSGNTQYQYKIEKEAGSPFLSFYNNINWGSGFVYGNWYNYDPSQPVMFDFFKQLPGVNSVRISVRKSGSNIIEAEKLIKSERRLLWDHSLSITPRSKTVAVNTWVKLTLNSWKPFELDMHPKIGAYSDSKIMNGYTNLPLLVEMRNNAGIAFAGEGGNFDENSNFPISITSYAVNGFTTPDQYRYTWVKPTTTGTYILRFNAEGHNQFEGGFNSQFFVENYNREITVVLNVIP